MNSAIGQMYYGKRGQGELLKTSEAYRKLYGEYCELMEQFSEKIKENEELLKLFNRVLDAHCEAQAEESKDYYAAGFRFGVLMGMDICEGD